MSLTPTKRHKPSIQTLQRMLSLEVTKAIGLSPRSLWSKLLAPLYWYPTQRFAELGVKFDEVVARCGFTEAARWVLPQFVKDIQVHHTTDIPSEGPLLIASNHPGTYDSLALAASLPRRDLKIIASAIPFIRNLPSTAHHLIYTTLNPHERMTVIRESIRHLREGGALLIFPSGNIDPDPAVLPGAEEALHRWSPSLNILLKRAPDARIVLAIVSGVLSPDSLRNPLTRLHSQLRERQKLAEFIQVLHQMIWGISLPLTPQITFSSPMTANELSNYQPVQDIYPSILEKARQLLDLHMNLFLPSPVFKNPGRIISW